MGGGEEGVIIITNNKELVNRGERGCHKTNHNTGRGDGNDNGEGKELVVKGGGVLNENGDGRGLKGRLMRGGNRQ